MQKNMGTSDRAIRIIAGVVLLVIAFALPALATGVWHWIALIVGGVLILTSLVGVCPAYLPFGLKTCRNT